MTEIYGITCVIAGLKDEDENVRESTAEALIYIKDPRVVEPLIAALEDEGLGVRKSAAEALGEITQKKFGENQEEWKN